MIFIEANFFSNLIAKLKFFILSKNYRTYLYIFKHILLNRSNIDLNKCYYELPIRCYIFVETLEKLAISCIYHKCKNVLKIDNCTITVLSFSTGVSKSMVKILQSEW